MFHRLQITHTNRPVTVIKYWRDEGALHLDAPYQRGSVWGETRRRNLIYSLLVGIPIPAILINDRHSGGWGRDDFMQAVIDGKQRCLALLAWFDDELQVPAKWFDDYCVSDSSLEFVTHSQLTTIGRRKFSNLALPFCEASLPDIEPETRAFDLINFGGVPQGESDL